MTSDRPNETSVLIVGAGMAGITTAIQLQRRGITDFTIVERDGRIGGTWRDARYPGARVDVPCLLYSWSFAPNPEWTRATCDAAEILAYIEATARRFDILRHIQFDTHVEHMAFVAERGVWLVTARGGRKWSARAVVAADGLLSNPQYPDIPGLDTFPGRIIHSARWDTAFTPHKKRVAIIGTGASAAQIVPEVARTAREVIVFQRTPPWVLPRMDTTIPRWTRTLFRRLPIVQRLARSFVFSTYEISTYATVWITPLTHLMEAVATRHLRRQVSDPHLRHQLTPTYRIGCKRPLISNDYYPTFRLPHCRLTGGASAVDDSTVISADGTRHTVDCIVLATGYAAQQRGSAITIVGPDQISLADHWEHGATAYNSVSVSGYPNLFITMGPNSFGHSSELLFIEAQVNYIVQGIHLLLAGDLWALDVRGDVQARHNHRLRHRLARSTFNSGCASWFRSPDGRNCLVFPGSVTMYRRALRHFNPRDYVHTPRPSSSDTPPTIAHPG